MSSEMQLQPIEHVTEQDLAGLRLMAGANLRVVASLLRECEVQTLAPDEILLAPGVPNSCLYLILRGRLSLHIESPETEPVHFVNAGDAIGEMSMISEKPVMGFAVAAEKTAVLKIEEEIFWSLVYTERAVSRNVLWMVVERLRLSASVLTDGSLLHEHQRKSRQIDQLTGLHNRATFQQMLRRQLARCVMGGKPVSLLYATVNGMDRFTREFGSAAANQAVTTVARVLQDHLRPTDIIGQMDGRHFAMTLTDCESNTAASIAKRLCSTVAETIITLHDNSILPPVSMSIGVSGSNLYRDADALIKSARDALARARRLRCPVAMLENDDIWTSRETTDED